MWFPAPPHDLFTRPRIAIAAALSTVAVASAGYYYFQRPPPQEHDELFVGLHRSNAIRRPRRNSRRRSRSTPAPRSSSPAASTASTEDAAGDQAAEDAGTVVDGDQDGMDDWYNEPQPQRTGHNIVTLLFRVSEDNSRRNACVHRGCQCNACSMAPIRGIRYRCATCADFDLCEACEAQGLHTKTHIFYKIKVPAPPSSLRQMQPVWYTGDPDSVHKSLSRTLMTKLSRQTGFERPELEAYWEQWTYMAATEWRDDPDELHLAMDRKTFERCLIPSGGSQHMAPNLIHDRMFAFYDTNNDGLIGFSEFLHGVAFRNRPDKLERVFNGYDLDGDGYIDRKDCLRMFRAYYVLFKEMHRDVLDGLDDQVMASSEAQQLVASRQPISSLFGRELTRMPLPDYNPDRLRGKVYHPNGHVDLPAGRTHAVRDERGDAAARRQVLSRLFISRAENADTVHVSAPAQYAESLLNPFGNNLSAIQALLSTLEAEGALSSQRNQNREDSVPTPPEVDSATEDNSGTSQDNGGSGHGDDLGPAASGSHQPPENQGRRIQTLQIMIPTNGDGEVHVSVTASDLANNPEQERTLRRRARRQLYDRWRRRNFYLDEEEGARAPRNWDEDDDILARTLEDLDRAKQRTEENVGEDVPVLSPRSRSSSKVRFLGDAEDLETRSNVSSSSRPVPERWGGMDIPDAERDAGKEILYQVAQQAFNEMLDLLFKDKEDEAMEVAATREERQKYADLIAAHGVEGEASVSRESGAQTIPEVRRDSEIQGDDVEIEEIEEDVRVADSPEPVEPVEPVVQEHRDPTLPQFRPDSDSSAADQPSTAPSSIPEPEESKVQTASPSSQSSSPSRSSSSNKRSKKSKGKRPARPPIYHEPPPAPILAGWKKLNEVEAEAAKRGGFGKLTFREFEEIYKGKDDGGSNLAYLGSWIEFCIP